MKAWLSDAMNILSKCRIMEFKWYTGQRRKMIWSITNCVNGGETKRCSVGTWFFVLYRNELSVIGAGINCLAALWNCKASRLNDWTLLWMLSQIIFNLSYKLIIIVNLTWFNFKCITRLIAWFYLVWGRIQNSSIINWIDLKV